MLPEEFDQTFKDIPFILEPLFKMVLPNEEVHFYQGTYEITSDDTVYSIAGDIKFTWLPSPSVRFSGQLKSPGRPGTTDVSVRFNDISLTGFIYHIEYTQGKILGFIDNPVTRGDTSRETTSVRFELPNFRKFDSDSVRYGNTGMNKNRLTFISDDFRLLVDRHLDFEKTELDLLEARGFRLLYSGELLSLKGPMKFEQFGTILSCVEYFLSFINGANTSPFFRAGQLDGETLWQDDSAQNCAAYQYVESWAPAHYPEFGSMWATFLDMWKNPLARECLELAIYWYHLANSGSANLEGSIILIQNALEVLFAWLIVDSNPNITVSSAKKLDSKNAHIKIEMLLNRCNISIDLPPLFSLLASNPALQGQSAPQMFTTIRNSFVHPKKANRTLQWAFNHKSLLEARTLALWYVELIILHTLDFHGHYNNRCGKPGDKLQIVPWDIPPN